jgi:ribonuclease HII
MLQSSLTGLLEAGCDEAGRGCLAGPVFAAAVILPTGYTNASLNDSKKLNKKERIKLRRVIESSAIAFAVASCSAQEIDERNILRASFEAMHRALDQLAVKPEFILVDGNRFIPWKEVNHQCIIKGDGKFLSIAAASILAKTYRDDYMMRMHEQYPCYGWNNNKGYPTALHAAAIAKYGYTELHRRSFHLKRQLHLGFSG